MSEMYCISCLQHRDMRYFTRWDNDRTQARRCDSCADGKNKVALARKTASERKAKIAAMRRPVPVDSEAASKRAVRNRIYDLKMKRELKDFIGE